MNSVYLSWKKNQEPNNLINQKDKKYIVPSTDIQKIDEIHSREKFKDFFSQLTPLVSLNFDQNLTRTIYWAWNYFFSVKSTLMLIVVLNIHGIFPEKDKCKRVQTVNDYAYNFDLAIIINLVNSMIPDLNLHYPFRIQ